MYHTSTIRVEKSGYKKHDEAKKNVKNMELDHELWHELISFILA
jgi:hypothetical protein